MNMTTVKNIEYETFDFCGELKFSGPGAQMAQYEKENRYPAAKAREAEESKKAENAVSSANNAVSEPAAAAGENIQYNNDRINPGWNLNTDFFDIFP